MKLNYEVLGRKRKGEKNFSSCNCIVSLSCITPGQTCCIPPKLFLLNSVQIFAHQASGRGSVGSTHSAIHLENPESHLRWYFKYFLGTGNLVYGIAGVLSEF